MITKSPLGGTNAVIQPTMKGKIVKTVIRQGISVHPLTILYGLHMIATITKRDAFTVREMLTADIDSQYISPIVAFGISADTFKKQCEGLRSRYPKLISTTFTYGNDEFHLPYLTRGLDDIIDLALEE